MTPAMGLVRATLPRHRCARGLAALGAGLCLAAQAQQPLWELGAGLAGVHLPHYRGSDQSHDWLLPVPYFVYRGQFLRATREGARLVLLDGPRFDVDLSVSASAPTRSGDSRARQGMPDLAPTLEFGPKLKLALARGDGFKLDLRLPVRAVFTLQRQPRAVGWTAGPVLNLDLRWQGWNLGTQAGPLWGSRRYHGYYYDVAPAYASAARPAYQAPGGAAGWHWTSAVSRRMGSWWLGAFVRGDRVAGAVFEPSPLVKQRSQLSYGLALSWVFAVSDERVAVDD